MAENSPMKRLRSSPQYHPYADKNGRSPLQGIKGPNHPNVVQNPRQVKPLPLPLVKDEKDFFSFSGGSSSLFPSSSSSVLSSDCQGQDQSTATVVMGDHRLAMSEVSNVITQPIHPHIHTLEKQNQSKNLKDDAKLLNSKGTFGVIGGNRKSASMGFIPVDQSCTIGGSCETEIIRFEQEAKPKKFFKEDNPWRSHRSMHGFLPNAIPPVKNVSSTTVKVANGPTFNIYVDNPSPSEEDHDSSFKENVNHNDENQVSLSNPVCDVTSGVLGQLQPRGLNSSFTDKFVSRLALNSSSDEFPEDEATQRIVKSQPQVRGILTEKFIPLFDYSEYTTNILKYWGTVERRIKVNKKYMEKQKEISYKMRSILVDWIGEVASEYDMNEQTLHLTVNYIDRFLSKMHCVREKLQLIGTTALLIASKFEEISPPEIADFVYVTDDAYTKKQITQMEGVMLGVLEFDLMVPTASDFVTAYCSVLKAISPIRCLAMYLADLSLLDERFLDYTPSVIATSAVVLGRYSFEHVYWDDKIRKLSTHRVKTITACIKQLVRLFFFAPDMAQRTFYEKYQADKFCEISKAFIPTHGPWSDDWKE